MDKILNYSKIKVLIFYLWAMHKLLQKSYYVLISILVNKSFKLKKVLFVTLKNNYYKVDFYLLV